MSNKFQVHVLIIGAGIGGLAAAIGIARAGYQVTVIEKSSQLGEKGAGIQVPPNSSHILSRWGLLKTLSAEAMQPGSIIIRSYHDDSILSKLKLKGRDSIEEAYDYPWLHIHRETLHKALSDEATQHGVVFRLGSTVAGIDFQNSTVRIQDQKIISADIIIGADGVNSVCREALLGRPDPPVLTGDMVYRISLSTTEMKKHVELEALATKPNFNYWAGPGEHAVGYLIEHGTQFNIVIAAKDNLPFSFSRGKGDVNEMRERFEGWSSTFTLLLELASESTVWRLCCGREMETWTHGGGSFSLLGDACHSMLPYLAQGAAQAVEDGAVLGALFSRCESREDVFDVLGVYEELRMPRANMVARVSREKVGMRWRDSGEGSLNPWANLNFQKELFGYDVEGEVDNTWNRYKAATAEMRKSNSQ
ncbi:FAD dependent oxidoreductase [Mollisia scopiformis]|uniref:FAD dependent oxidoreductase n=1 Tax=Mollisia scopiformis TaxID=149040 RepID=A0A194XGU2_MOLSC|nr:FAD dependent oxidoreductase [Mollisia scopiformis]KUJ19349.1 FAD dependent oxidoreductase [Mollisia scopiformis]